MSQYYNPRKTRNIFDPSSKEPFKISRSKIELFLECPKCFYLDLRFGIGRPPGYPFSLNAAVDKLLKKEFDTHRMGKSRHPLMEEYGIDALPYDNEKINDWRDTRKGISYLCQPSNFLFYGAVDDIWQNSSGQIHVVDYKATSKASEVTIDADWQMGYKRQIEMYQWLFKRNDFDVSDIGYFVYCNGNADKEAFDKKIEFDVKIIPYKGDSSWVEEAVSNAHKCLVSGEIPQRAEDCDYCRYREEAEKIE